MKGWRQVGQVSTGIHAHAQTQGHQKQYKFPQTSEYMPGGGEWTYEPCGPALTNSSYPLMA